MACSTTSAASASSASDFCHSACSSARMRAASSSCFLMSAISASETSIFFTSSSISTFNRAMVSVCSSIVLAATTAVRAFSARSFSHCSLMDKSFASSFFRNAIILSIASITASKCPAAFDADSISANCFKRASPLLAAAAWRVLTASNSRASDLDAERLRALAAFNCKNEAVPCDLNERLNKSRLSSLCRIATALFSASISPWRRTLRVFHSSFLVASAASVSLMNLRSASF
mmetsp:Transcript_42498/g.77123  ORF Transcript_42498/g.77123 Transcript_42498/m.77123 type:complete len:233 (-) Transcript_42498:966-1664(-)